MELVSIDTSPKNGDQSVGLHVTNQKLSSGQFLGFKILTGGNHGVSRLGPRWTYQQSGENPSRFQNVSKMDPVVN